LEGDDLKILKAITHNLGSAALLWAGILVIVLIFNFFNDHYWLYLLIIFVIAPIVWLVVNKIVEKRRDSHN
jgi:hypothetical protein